MSKPTELKTQVRDYWNAASCGEQYAEGADERAFYASQTADRYRLEPFIIPFAGFDQGRDRDVLEIGVGMGADHQQWALSGPRTLTGVDLTPRAIGHTRRRFELYGLHSTLQTGDAENLPFTDDQFDIVYSWGVLHHSPNTQGAIDEVRRVLRPGGVARIMVYHRWSLTGYMLWLRYALLRGRPWTGLSDIYAEFLESPGTKAYSRSEARRLFAAYAAVDIHVQLAESDLLEGKVGMRHGGPLLSIAKALWPRWLFRRWFAAHGLFLLIEARK